MKTAILFALVCLSGYTAGLVDASQCNFECKPNDYQPNSSYIFDLSFGNKDKVDASLIHSRDLKIFMVINYIHGISAAFHIDTPYITWANMTSNSILIYDYKREIAMLVDDKTKLEGVLDNKTMDIDLLLQRLTKIVQETSNFPNRVGTFNVTRLVDAFFKKEYDLQSIFKNDMELAKELESNFGLWFHACKELIDKDYINQNIGFVGFSSGVYGVYQKAANAVIVLLGQAYNIDAVSTDLIDAIVQIFTNRAAGYYISIVQLIARLKIYPNAATAIASLFQDVPLEIKKLVKVVKSTKFSFIVVTSPDHGYAIIIKNLANAKGNTYMIYNRLKNIFSIHNELLNSTVTVNPTLKMFAIFNYITNYGLAIDLNKNKATPFSNNLAAKYLKLSFQFRGAEQINTNLQSINQSMTAAFDFKMFLETLKNCKTLEICELQSIVPSGILHDLKTRFGGYFNLRYQNERFVNVLDSIRPVCGTTGVNLATCIVPFVKKLFTVNENVNTIAERFLKYVKGSIQSILSNITLNIDLSL